MTYARQTVVCLEDTPYYHVVARCVRRAWLWGRDEYAGKDYSHRRAWVLERLARLSAVFSIEICAYAVMSNHYHLVVFVDRSRASAWTQSEVVERWTRLFVRPTLVERWEKGECLEEERHAAERIIERWRRRLIDVSWYMRCLNEHLARRANAEDDCTGRFWEGRFKSQALLDDAGLLTAMAYVDLNPVRAGAVATVEQSEFTSIYQRIRAMRMTGASAASTRAIPLRPLRNDSQREGAVLPFSLLDYRELMRWTAQRRNREVRAPNGLPAVVRRFRIDADMWSRIMRARGNVFGRALGRPDRLQLHAVHLGQGWVQGLRYAAQLYGR